MSKTHLCNWIFGGKLQPVCHSIDIDTLDRVSFLSPVAKPVPKYALPLRQQYTGLVWNYKFFYIFFICTLQVEQLPVIIKYTLYMFYLLTLILIENVKRKPLRKEQKYCVIF